MGSVCMLISTEHHANQWDIIPRTLSDLVLHKNDRPSLHKKGFDTNTQIEYENEYINDVFERNKIYYDFFKSMQVEMVTTQQGIKEWHVCCSFSFTSSTMLEMISVLKCHKVDFPECLAAQNY